MNTQDTQSTALTPQRFLIPVEGLERRRATVEGLDVLRVQSECLIAVGNDLLVLWRGEVDITWK